MPPKKRPAAAHINHEPFDVPERAIGHNTPKKAGAALSTSKVWDTIKRLKTRDTRSQQLLLAGYTHICSFPLEPNEDTGAAQFCHHPLVLTRPNGTWIQTVAQRHLEQDHPDDPAAVESVERQEGRAKAKLEQRLVFDNPGTPTTVQSLGKFKLTQEQEELSSQAAWYVYAQMRVSKLAFTDPYWKNMLIKAGASRLLTREQLKSWVHAEYQVFKLFLRFILDLKVKQARGNPFAQFLHDGGTLDSHKKYQALGMQFILPGWDQNVVICFGFPRSKENKDAQVAVLASLTFKEMSGYDFVEVFATTIADRAAKGVAERLDHEAEVCAMHDVDKLGQSATGALVRSKNKIIVNPFTEGVKLMANARKMATDFTWDGWHEKLWELGEEHAGPKVFHASHPT